MELLTSFLPILLPFIFLVLLRMSAKKGMTLSFLIVTVFAYFVWQMELDVLFASMLQGAHKAFGILIILFGAIFMMNILKMNGAIDRINIGFGNLTKDMRIQTVIIAYLFGALIEGVAGFGTPAVVVAPLLVALGFSPLAAATVALISNSVPVPFAAIGTPVTIGLGSVRNTPEFFNEVARYITSIDFLAGALMPTIVVVVLITFFGKNREKKDYLEILPWTLFIGYSYTIIAFILARTVGYEFVTIGSSISMLLIATVTVKYKFLVPKNEWSKASTDKIEVADSEMSLIRAWLPYVVVILLLIISRVIPVVTNLFKTLVDISYNDILGFEAIDSSLLLLYSPGFIIIVAALLSVLIQKADKKNIVSASKVSVMSVQGAALSLIPTLAMVSIFANSAINVSDLASMPVYLATFLGEYFNGIWIILASYVGELGSFIAGSATVSAITFSPVQLEIASTYGLNENLILSLGLLGGAAGNMICVHNVVSVATVVNATGEEGNIIKKTVFPALIYALIVGLAAIIIF